MRTPTSPSAPIPPPPGDTMVRQHGVDDFESYLRTGSRSREDILSLLPGGWDFAGKRVLDMGCGAGRTLRHFMMEAELCEMWGCDIDDPSLAFLRANLSPPIRVLRGSVEPPLPMPDGYFHLVWSVSLFTHLTNWAEWMAELHRVLADDGLVICTYHGEAMAELSPLPVPWDEERAGYVIISNGASFAESTGPTTFASRHWLEEHWGRAFEIVELRPTGFAGSDPGQGVVMMRKRPQPVSAADLERVNQSDHREIEALRYQIEMSLAEVSILGQAVRALQG